MATHIIGMDAYSVLGNTKQKIYQSLVEGKNHYTISEQRIKEGYKSPFVGMIDNLDNQIIRYDNDYQMIYDVIKNALMDANLYNADIMTHPEQFGIIISTDSNIKNNMDVIDVFTNKNSSNHYTPSMSFDSLNSHVTIEMCRRFHFGGIALTVGAACSGGAHVVGLADMYLKNSEILKYIVVVGYQELGKLSQITFDAVGVCSSKGVVKPFDKFNDGTVPSGGCAAIVITDASKFNTTEFRNKHKNDYGTIWNYGYSVGINRITPDMKSIADCCRKCINSILSKLYSNKDANIYVNAHATGTKIGDKTEAEIVKELINFKFGEYVEWYMTSTKAITGHECWMSGVSEIIYSLLQIHNKKIIRQHNLENIFDSSFVNIIPNTDIDINTEEDWYILSNSFGFGGNNASILIRVQQWN